ncbi:UNVERIFIED_CONTAM: protein MIZU-KUSSEI 1 [Sesamum angustifolium]|uniref:Protein MIZU-KUSSEI 1 n=1 Tax=Sesamum angustifolium TaxID=2727405 RepID=A0AAW2RMK6_9LAMI
MSRNYDNWDRLVGAVMRREQLRQIALRRSRSSSYFNSMSSSPDLDDHGIFSNDERLLPTNYDLGQQKPRRKFLVMAVSKLRSALALGRARIQLSSGLGRNVVGTVFTCRRGHVHFAFQDHFNATPAFLVELPMPRSILLKEMSSGLVRIALECDKNKGIGLLAEPVWRTYCNGKKHGYAMRRECGPEEWKVLNAIGPISMGTGMLPAGSEHGAAESDGKLIYMRAKFENIVGSSDCEAFYMMNPDGNAAPELIIFLLRV